jgi:hypothetical protein
MGEFTFEPEDSSWSDLLRALLDFSNNAEVCSADVFVLMTNPILLTPSMSRPGWGIIFTASVPWVNRLKGGHHWFIPDSTCWRLSARCWYLIGRNGKNLIISRHPSKMAVAVAQASVWLRQIHNCFAPPGGK